MKIKSILLASAVSLFMLNCKDKTESVDTAPTEAGTTVTDDHSGHDHETQDSPVMAAMHKMMDKMHELEMTGNADYDLAASMKEHHHGSVDMAQVQLNSGSDATLKAIAQKIVDAQQMEIKHLDEIMSQSKTAAKDYDIADNSTGLGKAMADNMAVMMKMPDATGNVDKDFAAIMAKHHSDGIMVGHTIMKFAQNAKFKSMTEKMMADQNKQIKELETWLSAN